MRRPALLLASFLLALILISSCTTVQPTESLVVIEEPYRYFTLPPVRPFGQTIGVLNDTGLSLRSFDLFNWDLYAKANHQANLLEGQVEDKAWAVVDLRRHPALRAQLANKEAEAFIFNARDVQDNLYVGSWNPQTDSWLVQVTDMHLVVEPSVDRSAGSLVVVNKGDLPFEKLYIESKAYVQFDGSELNLLNGAMLEGGKRARIDIKLLASQEEIVNLIAVDTEGNVLSRLFRPATDPWLIKLGAAPGFFELVVENQTGETLWNLFAAPQEEYQKEELGVDLLGLNLLYGGKSVTIEQKDSVSGKLMIVGVDYNEFRYVTAIDTGMSQVVVLDSSMMIPPPERLRLVNQASFDIWFLYSLENGVMGYDLLEYGILERGEEFLLPVDKALDLHAFDELDNEYELLWSPGDPLTLTLTDAYRID